MPGKMDGLGLLHWIHDHHPEIPVVVTSAYSMRGEVLRLRRTDRFIAKPADPFLVVEAVREMLNRVGSRA